MNKLSVWHYGHTNWRRPTKFFSNIGVILRRFKYAWQRAKWGYCEYDVFDLDSYTLQLMGDSIVHLSECTYACPVDITYEDWLDSLATIGRNLQTIAAFSDDHENVYFNQFRSRLKEGMPEDSSEANELCDRIADEEQRLNRENDQLFRETWQWLGVHMHELWY